MSSKGWHNRVRLAGANKRAGLRLGGKGSRTYLIAFSFFLHSGPAVLLNGTCPRRLFEKRKPDKASKWGLHLSPLTSGLPSLPRSPRVEAENQSDTAVQNDTHDVMRWRRCDAERRKRGARKPKICVEAGMKRLEATKELAHFFQPMHAHPFQVNFYCYPRTHAAVRGRRPFLSSIPNSSAILSSVAIQTAQPDASRAPRAPCRRMSSANRCRSCNSYKIGRPRLSFSVILHTFIELPQPHGSERRSPTKSVFGVRNIHRLLLRFRRERT